MKITLCGSIAFYEEMTGLKNRLEKLGYKVQLPPAKVPGKDGKMIPVAEYYKMRKTAPDSDEWVWKRRAEVIEDHNQKIAWADAVLVVNFAKNSIENYIGGNTFLEMGVAFWLKKKIYLLNSIPEISYREEILGMKPVVINGDLNLI